MSAVEDELCELFREQAAAAPQADALAARARQALRRRRRQQVRHGLAGLAVISILGATAVGVARVHDDGATPQAAPTAPVAAPSMHDAKPSATVRTGPVLGIPSAAACAMYSPQAIRYVPLAFDGSVTAIGPKRTSPRRGDDRGVVVATKFTVNEWFRGDLGKSVTLDVRISGNIDDDGAAPPFEVGTRLLVTAAEAPVGDTQGFVGGCGFTHYYDPDTAAQWRAATR